MNLNTPAKLILVVCSWFPFLFITFKYSNLARGIYTLAWYIGIPPNFNILPIGCLLFGVPLYLTGAVINPDRWAGMPNTLRLKPFAETVGLLFIIAGMVLPVFVWG